MIVESYEDVIVLSGKLVSNIWETIHTAISLILRRHATGVIIDCSGITECTPEGAETFRDAMDFIQRFDARIIVAAVPAHVLEVLRQVPEVRSQLPIAESVEQARRSLDLVVQQEVKRRRAEPSSPPIIVCLTATESDEFTVKTARELASAKRCKVWLLFPILVPRDLPLQAPLPDLEQTATTALELADKVLSEIGIDRKLHIERARDIGSAILETANEAQAIEVLISLPGDGADRDAAIRLVTATLNKVNVPVVFCRA